MPKQFEPRLNPTTDLNVQSSSVNWPPIEGSKRKRRYQSHKQLQDNRNLYWQNQVQQASNLLSRSFLRMRGFIALKIFTLFYYLVDWIYLWQVKRRGQFTKGMVQEIKWYHLLNGTLRLVFLWIMALIVIFPFYWMISVAFRTSDEILDGVNGTLPLWPKAWSWGAFDFLFNNPKAATMGINVSRAIGMSILITFLSVCSQVIVSLFAGYGLVAFRHKANKLVVGLVLAAMILPAESLMIGQYLFVTKANLRDTLPALFIPFIGNAFTILMCAQAFEEIPKSLKSAAQVDGVSSFKFFWKIALPAVRTTIITAILISAISAWNAILWPTMVIQENKSYYTLPMILWQIMQSTGDPQGIWNYDELIDPQNLKMAASVVAILPMIILFLISKKYLIKGLTSDKVILKN